MCIAGALRPQTPAFLAAPASWLRRPISAFPTFTLQTIGPLGHNNNRTFWYFGQFWAFEKNEKKTKKQLENTEIVHTGFWPKSGKKCVRNNYFWNRCKKFQKKVQFLVESWKFVFFSRLAQARRLKWGKKRLFFGTVWVLARSFFVINQKLSILTHFTLQTIGPLGPYSNRTFGILGYFGPFWGSKKLIIFGLWFDGKHEKNVVFRVLKFGANLGPCLPDVGILGRYRMRQNMVI